MIEQAQWPGAPAEAPDQRRPAKLVLIGDSAVRAALQASGEETPAGEAALAERVAPIAERTNAAIVVSGGLFLAPDAPMPPAVRANGGVVVEGLLVAGEVRELTAADVYFPDLIQRIAGRVVWVDQPTLGRLRATTYEPGTSFTRETQWTASTVSANANATAWLDVDVLGSLDGPMGGCALLLADRNAVELGSLDLRGLAHKHALAVGVIG
jgi:hypothetical protein